MARVRARVWVSGRVQGVWFRGSTRERALELGLEGWVQNLPDGRVEAEFVGSRGAVEEALRYVAQGPELARVDSVEAGELEPVDEDASGRGFEVR